MTNVEDTLSRDKLAESKFPDSVTSGEEILSAVIGFALSRVETYAIAHVNCFLMKLRNT